MAKINCWDLLNCGKKNDCPAAKSGNGDGMHGGEHRGRFCWTITGTLCDNDVQGDFAHKINNCINRCDVFPRVKDQEGSDFIMQ